MINEILFTAHVVFLTVWAIGSFFACKEALITVTALFTLLANLFVTKQITLFGLDVTATDSFAIGAVLGINMLQEYYGNKIARLAIAIGFATAIFFSLASTLHLWYQPNNFDQSQEHFMAILCPMPRIIVASLLAYFSSQNFDYFLFNTLKKTLPASSITVRFFLSTMLSQLLDTILFSFFGLYGIVHNIVHVIIISYIVKMIVITASTPFLWIASSIKKRIS